MASSSKNDILQIWNVETGTPKEIQVAAKPTSLEWNYDGSLLVGNYGSDKKIRVIDPRAEDAITLITDGHQGPKNHKVTFCGLQRNYMVSSGYSKNFRREIALRDMRVFDKPVQTIDLDSGAGLILPVYDADTDILFLGAKGDGHLRHLEFMDGKLFMCGTFKSKLPMKSVGFFPRRCVDTSKNEVIKAVKICKNSIEIIHFIAPRRVSRCQMSNSFHRQPPSRLISTHPASASSQP